MKAKAVCVMRTDLRNTDGNKVPKGKLIAQGGHAFLGLITRRLVYHPYDDKQAATLFLEEGSAFKEWLTHKFTKVVLAVDSEEELLAIADKVICAKLNYSLIMDNGETEFGGVRTLTCIGIGPDWEDKIDAITGHLKGFQ
jgi:peptidyl-tRNA hydrolase, PTH2 family